MDLAAGERCTLRCEVPADLSSFTGRDLRRRVEPGRLVLAVAQAADDPGLRVEVDLTGDVRLIDHTRSMSTFWTV